MEAKNHVRLATTLITSLLLCGCATQQVEPIGDRGPDLQNYTAEQVRAEAVRLMDARGFDDKQRQALSQRLDRYLAEHDGILADPGVTGVAVYHTAGGGFVFKGSGGKGLASFCGGEQQVPFVVSGYEVGGVVGGGSHNGIALAIGLRDQRRFRGHYESTSADATGGVKAVGDGRANYVGDDGHSLRYFAIGVGVEANATFGRFTVELDGEQ
ncbi:MAG: hypothetical protein ACE37K_17990 [Planctomycetota bacterium]